MEVITNETDAFIKVYAFAVDLAKIKSHKTALLGRTPSLYKRLLLYNFMQ